jgi:hypothetical protein
MNQGACLSVIVVMEEEAVGGVRAARASLEGAEAVDGARAARASLALAGIADCARVVRAAL